jgi:hypothetical protein
LRTLIYAMAMYARELERKDAMEAAQVTGAAARGAQVRMR